MTNGSVPVFNGAPARRAYIKWAADARTPVIAGRSARHWATRRRATSYRSSPRHSATPGTAGWRRSSTVVRCNLPPRGSKAFCAAQPSRCAAGHRAFSRLVKARTALLQPLKLLENPHRRGRQDLPYAAPDSGGGIISTLIGRGHARLCRGTVEDRLFAAPCPAAAPYGKLYLKFKITAKGGRAARGKDQRVIVLA